jgi:hypothetical protein
MDKTIAMKKYLIPLIFLSPCCEVLTANRNAYVYIQTATFSIGEVTVSNRFGTTTTTISSNKLSVEY